MSGPLSTVRKIAGYTLIPNSFAKLIAKWRVYDYAYAVDRSRQYLRKCQLGKFWYVPCHTERQFPTRRDLEESLLC